MADTDSISLRDVLESSPIGDEQNHGSNHGSSRWHDESDRKRLLALIGSALSQFPIWGI
jgi:hypothetical protein